MDSSWESGEEPPRLELTSAAQLPDGASCLACSDDGRYLGVGQSQGLSVWCAASLTCVADWLQDNLEMTSIQMSRIAEAAYLLGTVDDMGVARVFAYHSKNIHLLSVTNSMEDINKRSICLTFELSGGGHYGAASFRCKTACWLEIYNFPLKAWLKELAASQTEDPNTKWSLLSVEAKIKPPKISAGTGLEGPLDVLSDLLTYCLAQDDDAFVTMDPKRCTQHFLLSCGRLQQEETSQAEAPVAVCLWWSGSHSLLQYGLQEATTKKRANALADVLVPNAKRILCSAVSTCTRYVALGLEDAVVCVWDRKTGSPLSVWALAADSPFFQMHFVETWPDSRTRPAALVHFLVVCKSGEMHTVTADRWTPACTALLSKTFPDRPKDSKDVAGIVVSLAFLRCLMLVVQRNGKMFLQDVMNNKPVCVLVAPKPHLIAAPSKPVFALNAKQQTLYIRGDQGFSTSSPQGDHSQLLTLQFGQSDILRPYVVSFPQQNPQSFANLEETCDQYLQQRALAARERSEAITQAWKRLQESGDTMPPGEEVRQGV